MSLFKRILRTGEGRKLKALTALVPDINALEPEMQRLDDTGVASPHRRASQSAGQRRRAGRSAHGVLRGG